MMNVNIKKEFCDISTHLNLQHKEKVAFKNATQNEDKGGARMRILAPIFFLYEILKPKMSSTRKKRC